MNAKMPAVIHSSRLSGPSAASSFRAATGASGVRPTPGGKMRATMKTAGDSYTTTSGLVGADGKVTPAGTGKAARMK